MVTHVGCIRRRLQAPGLGALNLRWVLCWVWLAIPGLPAPARTGTALADVPTFQWNNPEVVDTGVTDVSDPGGVSVVVEEANSRHRGWWDVVYIKNNQVYLAVRDQSGWQTPVQVSSGAGNASNPRIGTYTGGLDVVWQDDRTGHAEIWTRSLRNSVWLDETCLSCDSVASSAPALAMVDGSYESGMVVWQDGPDGRTQIKGCRRPFNMHAWGPVETISQSPKAAWEPSITVQTVNTEWYAVAWTDSRNGASCIYQRRWDQQWQPEMEVTNLLGNCRHPSVGAELCCGGVIDEETEIAFENDGTGVPEVWLVGTTPEEIFTTDIISANDGIPSHSPQIGGFGYADRWCNTSMGGTTSIYLPIWTDDVTPHLHSHQFIEKSFFMTYGEEAVSETGLGRAVIAGAPASPPGPASLLAVYLEEHDGQSELMARGGTLIGCHEEQVVGPRSILLMPGGSPADTVRIVDVCSGQPVAGETVTLVFFTDPDTTLTWDPTQVHPQLPWTETDSEGRAFFSIRGGGCSPTGTIGLMCQGNWYLGGWTGARSPDIDGDCMVGPDDVAYVRSELGTNDFCADLDGSGVVDSNDLAIVTRALGEKCTGAGGIPDPASAASSFLTVFPNPCRSTATIRLGLPVSGPANVRVLDAGGRLVRTLSSGGARSPDDPVRETVAWDLRDEAGRFVPAGFYAVVAGAEGRRLTRGVLVVR